MRQGGAFGVGELGVVLALFALAGCASTDATEQSAEEAVTEATVLEGALGDSYELRARPAAEVGKTAAMHVVSFPITPTRPFAAVMRRTDDSALDPWLALYVDGERVAISDWDQAVVPMADQADAAIVYAPRQDGQALVVAGDLDLEADGTFQLDLVALDDVPSTTLPFHETSPGTRALNEVLREREAQTQSYLDAGMVSEGEAGLLDEHPELAPTLKDRAALHGFVTAVNDERGQLFREIVRSATGGQDEALELEAGAICGRLWTGLRSDAHRLR